MKKVKKHFSKLELFEDALENPRSRFFGLTNDLLAFATIISVVAIVLETVAVFDPYHLVFKALEYGVTILFTVEYFARLHKAEHKVKYIFSFFGIIDLFAILPTYLGLGNFTFLKTTRTLRIVRLLRIIRLAKLTKLKKKEVSSLYTLNIEIYAITLVTAMLLLGVLFYIFEGHQAYAQDIPSAMYWVFKAIIGGIAYQQPATTGGTIVLIFARFCSMILLGLMLSLVGTILRKLLIGSEKDS
jgi:voltage-gated potassium channel